MAEQKFQIGEEVRIRPFAKIDEHDIGRLRKTSNECFDISKDYINARTDRIFSIEKCGTSFETYVYLLRDESGRLVSYWWAQGMLDFASDEEISEPDKEGLFTFLF